MLPVKAVSLYGGGSLNFGAVVSDSEFYNGATGAGPGLLLGAKFKEVSFEFFYRDYSLSTDHEVGSTNFHLEIDDKVLGLGMRYNFLPMLNYSLGVSMQKVSTEATASNSNVGLGALVNENLMGFYLGAGLNLPAYLNGLEFYSDFVYFRANERFSMFSLDFGLRYSFLSL